MGQKLSLIQEYQSLSKIRKGIFLSEFSHAVSKQEIVNSFLTAEVTSFAEAFERLTSKKFYLFKIPSEGRIKRAIGYIVSIESGQVSARLYHPIEESFFDNWFELNLEEYGVTWYVKSDIEFKLDMYKADHANLEDYLEDHTGIDFKSTGETFLLVAEVPGEGWKEWEVLWLYDKPNNNIHVLTAPDMERFVLDVDYYGEEWFLIPL